MSRCFPFPSSDLSRKDTSQVGSIKKPNIESGNVKHRKEKNRENKENKKRSRQQDKLNYSVHEKKKLRRDQESLRDWKKDALDQCEVSGVTEEQGLPSSVPNPCNSLESTQNSSKKNMLLVSDMKKDRGLVLRIKLPMMKHKEPVTANEDPCFSGRVTEALRTEGVSATDFISSSCGILEMGKCFGDLILNWNPSSLQSYNDLNPGSEDWLFALLQPRKSPPSNCKSDHKVGLISANSLQPQACYLPEFDVYQLPYVIPF